MKITIHMVTASVLLTLSANAGAISKVHTEKGKATIEARLDTKEEMRLFVGDESLGWSVLQSKPGAVTATVEASTQIRLEDGSLGKGFIYRASGATSYVAMTPGGPIPFGELVFRDNSKVSAKDGTYTFADVRKPDGALVPVSIRVRPAPVN
jgi:hypothetical protein